MVQRTIGLAILAVASLASAAPKAKVIIARPTIAGAIDAKAVDAAAQRTRGKLLACYEKGLARDPGLTGTVVMTFSVGADGKIANAYASGFSADVRDCVSDAIGKLAVGKPKDGNDAAIAIVVMFDNGLEKVAIGSLTQTDDVPAEPRAKAVPNVSVGQPNAEGDLDKAIIRRYIKRNIHKIQYCYEKTLLEKPGLEGTVLVEFTIGRDGKVKSSTGSGLDKVDRCVADVIHDIEFPKPQGGGDVRVNYPFVFHEDKK